MRVGAEKPARPDHASCPSPHKIFGGAAKSRPRPAYSRVSPSPLRCPAYKRKQLVGKYFSPRFPPPTTSPPPSRCRYPAAQDFGESSRQQLTERTPHARGLHSPPCAGGPPDLRICGPSPRGRRIWLFRPSVAAPSDGVVEEHLPQPRQGRIAACRYGFVLPALLTICGHGFVRPSIGLGARTSAL